jgi:hypothetical protein
MTSVHAPYLEFPVTGIAASPVEPSALAPLKTRFRPFKLPAIPLATSRKPVFNIKQSVHTPRLDRSIGIVSVLAPRMTTQLIRRSSPHINAFSPLSLPRTIDSSARVSHCPARHPLSTLFLFLILIYSHYDGSMCKTSNRSMDDYSDCG